MRVAVLGTGLMGAPMARNLARAGHAVTVWNRSPDKAAALAADGISAAASAPAAAGDAEVVVVMVSTGDVVDDLLFGPAGAADAMTAGAGIVVMSSIPVESARRQAAQARERELFYVDAPVSGGEQGAIDGSLTIMAGGDAADIARLMPVFAALGRATHVGPVGAGQLAKLANQLIVGVTIGAVAEALLLIETGGGDVAATHAALQGGFADSTVLRAHGARMIARRFAPGAHATTQLKDLRTVLAQAGEDGIDLPFANLSARLFAEMCDGPLAALDHSALYAALRRRNGLAIA